MASWENVGVGAMTGATLGNMIVPGYGAVGGAAIGGLAGLFGGKKKSQNQPDPLAGLRAQLQELAGQVPAQVAKQKELTAGRITQARTEGQRGIAENLRAERGFGSTSLEARLNAELTEKLARAQSEADLQSDIWGTGEQARILQGTAGMYPGAEQEEGLSWQSQLLGAGTSLVVQNWMDEDKWKNIDKYLGKYPGKGTPTTFPETDWSFLDEPANWKSLTKLSP